MILGDVMESYIFLMEIDIKENGKIIKMKVHFYSNGDKYECEFKNDKNEGYGILYYPDGNRYEGEWKNNLMEGYGIVYCSDGNIYKIAWKNNLEESNGIIFFVLEINM